VLIRVVSDVGPCEKAIITPLSVDDWEILVRIALRDKQ
jgi:hypothetical protein